MKLTFNILLPFFITSFLFAEELRLVIDENKSLITFTGHSIIGNNINGEVFLKNSSNFDSAVTIVKFPVSSLTTGNKKIDNLMHNHYMEEKIYPDISFSLCSFQLKGKNLYEVSGDLNIHKEIN